MSRLIVIDGTQARLLAPLLVVAVLACHGFFGALHQLSGPVSSGTNVVASAPHAGSGVAGHGAGDAGASLSGHLGASDYAAVVTLSLLWGAVLSFGGIAWTGRLPLAVNPPASPLRRLRLSPVFVRGADPSFSQVFRL